MNANMRQPAGTAREARGGGRRHGGFERCECDVRHSCSSVRAMVLVGLVYPFLVLISE